MRVLFLILLNLIIFNCSKNKDDKKAFLNNLINGWSSQFFMRNSLTSSENRGNDMEALLKQVIGSASKKVYCSFQDINLLTVIDTLREKMSAGVDVKIGLDEDNRTQIGYRLLNEFLSDRGEARRLWIGNKGESQVYMNICVSDERRVFFSTSAPTIQGFYNRASFYFYIQSNEDGIAKKFAQAMDLITNGAFGSSKQKLNQRNHFLINDLDVGVYFAPEEKPIDFIEKRITGANESIQIYTTEFYANKLDSDFDTRITSDISFEILNSSVGYKQIIGSQFASLSLDPSAAGDCTVNSYLGISCDPTKSTGSSSNNPRPMNSLSYLRKNGITTPILSSDWHENGLNLVLIDSLSASPMAFISSHPFSSRANSSHDGVMITLEHRGLVSEIRSVYDKLAARAIPSVLPTGDTSTNPLDIVISELNWMGGYSSGKATEFEYLELFNNTSRTINISGWKFECGVNGSFNTVFTFPARTIIGGNQFFVISDTSSKLLAQSHLLLDWGGEDKIDNTFTDQCRILDSQNKQIDIAGVQGISFLKNPNQTGQINIDNKTKRSMERNILNHPGNNLQNWHTNSNNSYRNNANFSSDHLDGSFGTPGYANSVLAPLPPYVVNPARVLVINEVGIDDPLSNDQWVEIYNPSNSEINLTANSVFLRRDSSCSISTGDWTTSIPLTGSIPAKGYYLVTRSTASSSILSIANQVDFSTISTNNCIALTISNDTEKSSSGIYIIDFVNLGGAGDRENNSFVSVTSNSSYSRCQNGKDTNWNASDFLKKARSPKAENPCPSPPTSLLITEWSDGATNFDFIELRNFSSNSVVLDSDLFIEYGTGFSQSESIFQYAGTSNTFGALPTGGVSISPNEIVLITESDGDLAGLRAVSGFTGKIFSLNRTSLMTSGSNQLIRQNQARLRVDSTIWSTTPSTPMGSFTLGTAFLRNGFNFSTDSTTDISKWGETSSPSPGVTNPP